VRYTAITPYLYDAFIDDYAVVYWNDNSALSSGERLYTMEGSHSAGIGLYMSKKLNIYLDKGEDHQSFKLLFQFLYGTDPIIKYKVKTAYIMERSSSIRMGDKDVGSLHDITLSIPSALAYTLFFNSRNIEDLRFSDMYIKSKEGTSDTKYSNLVSDMKK
jgi:hypothetical protein